MLAAARLQGMFCLSKKYIKIHNPTLRNRMQMKRIADIPKSDRPREKMQQKGAEALSDHELLAILLGSGTRDSDVMTVAGRILKVLD